MLRIERKKRGAGRDNSCTKRHSMGKEISGQEYQSLLVSVLIPVKIKKAI